MRGTDTGGLAMKNALTELEACVLGLVSSEGPCTPYHVHHAVGSSPSPHWSGSAGAIYPLITRLERRGLIQTSTVRRGRRVGRLCRISPAGRRALLAWLGPPFPDWIAALPIDPLRTRLRFLGALPPQRRRQFVTAAREAVRQNVTMIRADCIRLAKGNDPFEHAMARGGLHVARARLAWLSEVAKMLDGVGRE
jgi:DNA-binding PadR family transcriptional regulator